MNNCKPIAVKASRRSVFYMVHTLDKLFAVCYNEKNVERSACNMKTPRADELERICAYCEHATVFSGTDACICSKRGVVRANECCRRFRPDLLKVQPRLPQLPEEAEDETFDLLLDP